jgi:ABC-2 type transport system ATP-binding protein
MNWLKLSMLYFYCQNVLFALYYGTHTSAFIDERFLIDFLSPKEYFYFPGDIYGIPKKDVDSTLVDFVPFMGNEILNQKKYIDKF